MSINFSEQSAYKNTKFGTNVNLQKLEEHQPVGVEVAKGMDLPTTPDEFRSFAPYTASAVGLSLLISKLGTAITRLNPFKNPNITVEDSFNKSLIAKSANAIDSKLLPFFKKLEPFTNKIKAAGAKLTPSFVKNICEKIKIGVKPKSSMALYTYNGPTKESAKYFFDCISKLDKEFISKLGIDDLILKSAHAPKEALLKVAERLSKLPAKSLTKLGVTNPGLFSKHINLIDELNKSRAFIAKNAKTPISKGLQKLTMTSAEAAGGGVIGGNFGMLMNALFIASGIKRTWNAPKGEKFKTAMEALFVDFCGLYLMNLFGVKLAYKILGIKNLDKTPAQIKNISNLTKAIVNSKNNYKMVNALKTSLLKEGLTSETLGILEKLKIDPSKFKTSSELLAAIAKKAPSAAKINLSIDKLAQMKKYKPQGFLKDLLYRPLTMLGKFFSVGLENTPSKLADASTGVSLFKALKGGLKNGLKFLSGYPIRLFLIVGIITPPLTKLFAKMTYSIFGKPSNPIVNVDKKNDETSSQTSNIPLININDFTDFTKQHSNQHTIQPESQQSFYNPFLEQAILAQKQKSLSNKIEQPVASTKLNNSSPVASSSLKQNTSNYTYIPSSKPTMFTYKLDDEIAKRLKRSESYEIAYNRAMKDIEKGNY